MGVYINTMSNSDKHDEKFKKIGVLIITGLTYFAVGPAFIYNIFRLLGHIPEITVNNYVVAILIIFSLRMITRRWRPEDFD